MQRHLIYNDYGCCYSRGAQERPCWKSPADLSPRPTPPALRPGRAGRLRSQVKSPCSQTPAPGWSRARRTLIVPGPRKTVQGGTPSSSRGTFPQLRLPGLGMGLHVATSPFLERDTREHTRHLRATRSLLGAQRTPAAARCLRAVATGLPESSPVAAAAAAEPGTPEAAGAGPGLTSGGAAAPRPRPPHLERGPGEAGRGCGLAWRRRSAPELPERDQARGRVSGRRPPLQGETPAGAEPAPARRRGARRGHGAGGPRLRAAAGPRLGGSVAGRSLGLHLLLLCEESHQVRTGPAAGPAAARSPPGADLSGHRPLPAPCSSLGSRALILK